MCRGDELLKELSGRQVVPELKCTVDVNCWCMKVTNDFAVDWHAECMSPAEMLAQTEVELSAADKAYLEPLTKMKFVRKHEI